MPTPTNETMFWQKLEEIKTLLEELKTQQDTQNERQGATARSVTRLAQGLTKNEELRRGEDTELARITKAIIEFGAILSTRDVGRMTPEQLAGRITLETASRVRSILYARARGEADPLPPTPNVPVAVLGETSSGAEIIGPVSGVPVMHMHRRKTDNSVTIKTDREGNASLVTNLQFKTLGKWILKVLGWAVGAAALIYEIIKNLKGGAGSGH